MKKKSNKKDTKAEEKELVEETTNQDVISEDETNKTKSNNETSKEEKTESFEEKPKEETIEEKYNTLNDKYLRLSAEFDNYRKRTLKERMELIKNAGEDILINFLPVIDNLDRAKKSVDDAKDIEGVKQGVELIYNNLKDFLSQRGIKEIQATGSEFDTDLHEAITKIPAPEESMKDKVIDVIEKGYKLHDKVIRYAKVVIGE